MASIKAISTVESVGQISTNLVGTELALDDTAMESFNTYKNFGIFPAMTDLTGVPENNQEGWINNKPDRKLSDEEKSGHPAVRSLFNPFSAVVTGSDNSGNVWGNKDTVPSKAKQTELIERLVKNTTDFRITNNAPLLDSPDVRKAIRDQSKCSIHDLVAASRSGELGRGVYNYADFMYCKHVGKVSNNYLITLRRFPVPMTDSLYPESSRRSRRSNRDGGTVHPIGTMVTWMGVSGNNMKDILKYSFSMPYEEKQAQWEELTKHGGTDGPLNAIEAAINPTTRKAFVEGKNVPALNNYVGRFGGAGGPYPEPGTWYDSNKVYGPIDRVKSNYRRSEEGLKQQMSYTLTFEYELRAYNGINPKQAMLDLIANILAITYTNGGFWKGGYRGGGVGQSSIYRNLKIFKTKGSFTDFMDSFISDTKTLSSTGLKTMGIDLTKPETILKAIAGLVNNVGGMLMGGLLNKLGRPAQYTANSLLSEAPTGLWHVVIGNPRRPIMMMGNMVLKNTTIEHSGPLGLDDFPTQLKVTVELDRGKPRDAHGLENLYMRGNDRIFYSMSRAVTNMYAAAARYKSESSSSTFEVDKEAFLQPGTEKIIIKDVEVGEKSIYQKYLGPTDLTALMWSAREQAEGAFKITTPKETTNDQAAQTQ